MNNGSRHTLVIGEGVPEPRSPWSGVHAGSSMRWYHLGERRRLLVFTLTGTAYFTCKNRDGLCRPMSLGSLGLHCRVTRKRDTPRSLGLPHVTCESRASRALRYRARIQTHKIMPTTDTKRSMSKIGLFKTAVDSWSHAETSVGRSSGIW